MMKTTNSCWLKLNLCIFLFLSICTAAFPAAGDLDTSFSTDGKIFLDVFGQSDSMYALAQQGDGKIIAVGTSSNGPSYMMIGRFLADGTPDSNFNGSGYIITNTLRTGSAVVLQPDGKIIVGGSSVIGGAVGYNFGLIRYDEWGTLDTSFGVDGNGTVSTDFGGSDVLKDLVVQPDGKIVALGETYNGGDFKLARYSADGAIDSDFGTDGMVVLPVSSGDAFAASLAIQKDGKIVVGGTAEDSNGVRLFTLARVKANGKPDTTFSGSIVQTSIKGNEDWMRDLLILPNGHILTAGFSKDDSSQNNFALVEYSSTGAVIQTEDTDLNTDSKGMALARRADGKIVVAGTWGSNLGLLQYTSQLDLDTGFGNNGVASIDVSGSFDNGYAVLIQSDGRIVIAGQGLGATSDFALARVYGFDSVLLADDFDGASPDWTNVSGMWVESAGRLLGVSDDIAIAFAPVPWSPSGNSGCSMCTILTAISTDGGANTKVIIRAWYQDKANRVELTLKNGTDTWELKQKANGVIVKKTLKHSLIPQVGYAVALNFDGTYIHLSIDGQELLKMKTIAAPYGNVGFKTVKTDIQIQHVIVY